MRAKAFYVSKALVTFPYLPSQTVTSLPDDFYADLASKRKRREAAKSCRVCQPNKYGRYLIYGKSITTCPAGNHEEQDGQDTDDWCEFHEHDAGSDDERKICRGRRSEMMNAEQV